MANKRWIHLPVATMPEALGPCEQRNDEGNSNRTLSVVWNLAQDEAILKVDGADRDWRAGQSWIEEALAVYDWDSIDALRSMLSGPAWRAPDAET